MLWAAIFLPQLALDGVLRRHAAPEAPLVLLQGSDQHRIVFAVNPAAQAAGLRPGLSLNAALALLPSFESLPYNPQEFLQYQEFLAAWAYRYSSLVYLDGSDILLLEIEASLGLFGPWPKFEHQLRADLTALGFHHQLALAPTARAACVLATAHDGALAFDRTQLRKVLAAVPLQATRLPSAQIAALAGMGIRTLQQLLALPRTGLTHRFGSGLSIYLEELLGDRIEIRDCYRPPDVFDLKLEFNYEIVEYRPLLFPLKRLLGDLGVYLEQRDEGVQHFEVRLFHAEQEPTSLPIGLLSPTRDASQLYEFCRSRLEQLVLPAAVRGLQLCAHELPPLPATTRDLFAPETNGSMTWEILRERLRAKFGNNAVMQILPHADARPEYSMRTVVQLTEEPPSLALPPRPTWLLPAPVLWEENIKKILKGPERIEAGWWDGEDFRRDYYIIQTYRGQIAWVFRPVGIKTGPWMLHGWFA